MDKVAVNKVNYFKKCIIELSNFLKLSRKTFCENTKNTAAAQMYLYGAIQTAIFLAAHTIQIYNFEKGSNYYEIFQILCKNGKLNSSNLKIYTEILDLRNILLYNYDEINGEYVYSTIEHVLPIFNIFLKDLYKRG